MAVKVDRSTIYSIRRSTGKPSVGLRLLPPPRQTNYDNIVVGNVLFSLANIMPILITRTHGHRLDLPSHQHRVSTASVKQGICAVEQSFPPLQRWIALLASSRDDHSPLFIDTEHSSGKMRR